MALTRVTVREKATLVSLADPEVQLRPGLRVSGFFALPAEAVVEESDAIVGEGATRIVVRGLRDTELASFAGEGQASLFLSCGRRATRKVRHGSWEDLPWQAKQYAGAWVFYDSIGSPIRCEAIPVDDPDDDEDDALDNPVPPPAPTDDEDDAEEAPPVDPLASS